MIPIAIVAVVLSLPAPIRVRQALPTDLDFTVRGCANMGIDTPEWCGPPAQAQGPDVLRAYHEHVLREIPQVPLPCEGTITGVGAPTIGPPRGIAK